MAFKFYVITVIWLKGTMVNVRIVCYNTSMQGKTLTQYSYRGINTYVRWLDGLNYEVLIAYKGGIYCHQLQLLKPHGAERRNNIEERHRGATAELQMIAASLIDDLKEKGRPINKIKTIIKKWKQTKEKD